MHVANAEWAWRSSDRRQLVDFYRGIKAFRHHPYRRHDPDRPVIWQESGSRLLDYGPEDGSPLLVVPSLVNRSYILDLMPGHSLLGFLSDHGIRPLLLDWGGGNEGDQRLDLNGLIARRMSPLLAWLDRNMGGPPSILGYCMGGTLATALASRDRDKVAGLALLAAPWDFDRDLQAAMWPAPYAEALACFAGRVGGAPVDMLQAFFAQIDPLDVPRKFARFARTEPGSDTAVHFVAIEDWLNDGASLSADIATQCLLEWYGSNAPARGAWCIEGHYVQPGRLDLPVWLAVPQRDRIVPPASALALARDLPNCSMIRPKSGHVGMLVGRHARVSLWEPLLQWLRDIAAMQKSPW